MAVVENRFVCDLSKPVQAQALKGNVFSLDNLGSRLSVLIYENGQPATISGSITANCILPDGSTVNVNGGLTTENGGSKAYVDVPQSCLLIPGILKIAIKCTSSSVITTLAAIVANVYMTKTDNVITPSQQIINDWNAEISAAIATQNAAIANQDTKINDLKSALNFDEYLINNGEYTIKAADLESGQWSYSTKASNAARARTKYLIPVRAGMTISYSNTTFDTFFGVLETPTSGSYIQTPGWKTDGNGNGIVNITKDGYLTFIIRNHADTSATVDPAEYNSIVTIRTNLITPFDETLPNNSDLNDIQYKRSVYYLSSDYTYSNAPNISENAFLFSESNIAKTRRTQRIETVSNRVYRRSYTSQNGWTSWVKEFGPITETLPNNSDLNSVDPKQFVYYLSKDNTYTNAPVLNDNAFLYSILSYNQARIIQKIETFANVHYYRSYTSPNWTPWIKELARVKQQKNGKYIVLNDTALIMSVSGNTGNVVISNKNLFHLVPSIESSNGIEWTENSDGSITFSGTATAKASFKLFDTNDTPLPCTQYYTVSFGREGDDYQQTDIGYALYVCEYDSENQWVRQIHDIGEGISFPQIQGNRYTIVVKIESGVSISDLKCAFQIEFGEKKTAFVKHQHTSFPVGTTYTNRMFDGENILYSENPDTDITVEYTDIEYDTADKNDLLFDISNPAQGTETEDPGVVFRRIKDTSISGTYKLLTDYRSYNTSAFSVITDEFGFGVRQYSSGNNRLFSSNSHVSSIGNYICVPIFVENLDNLDVVRFAITDTSNKNAVFDIKDELHEGINWFITNLYFATLTSGFNKNSIASVYVKTQAKANRSGAVTWGVFHTYDFRPMCTYIFDDGWHGCATYTAPTMAAHGFRGVFAVPTGKIGADAYHMNEAQLKSLVDGGNDVISHTRDHVNLVTLTPTRQEYQIRKAREYLIQHAPGRNAYYFAPPNVNMINAVRFHERVEPVMNRNATVIKRSDDKFTMLPNLHPELTYCWGTNNTKWEAVFPTRVYTPEQMKAKIDIAIEYGLWVGFGMHYFTDTQDNFFDRDGWLKSDFEEVMDYLEEHSADIDVVTYRQAYDRM